MELDIRNLRERGLIEEKTLFRAHKPHRRLLTLTRQGRRALSKSGALARNQEIYHGFVNPRELDHDADLYKIYQEAIQGIRDRGGNPRRVRLDFELKRSVNQEKAAVRLLPEAERTRWLKTAARDQGLSIKGTSIHLPDLQIEYETQQGELRRENLELVSRSYREAAIRGKAQSGFRIYARTQDTNRVRRALQDTGLVHQVLAI
ncbi:MAG: hypothetical protein WB630_19145 [Candidatus Acidiferrales bacterium]